MFTFFGEYPVFDQVNDYTDLVLICVLFKIMCALSGSMLTFGSYNLKFTQENDLLWLNTWKPCISTASLRKLDTYVASHLGDPDLVAKLFLLMLL